MWLPCSDLTVGGDSDPGGLVERVGLGFMDGLSVFGLGLGFSSTNLVDLEVEAIGEAGVGGGKGLVAV
jgi:hypothetical protein